MCVGAGVGAKRVSVSLSGQNRVAIGGGRCAGGRHSDGMGGGSSQR